jgi:hypothetical protein
MTLKKPYPKLEQCELQSPPLDRILSQFHLSQFLTANHINIHLLFGLSYVCFPRGFPTNILYAFTVSHPSQRYQSIAAS